MKNLILSLCTLGVVFVSFAQEPEVQVEVIELEGVVLRPPNFEYLATIQNRNTPATVKVLEGKAAYYDIEESDLDTDSFDAYEVFFFHSGGRVIATYDKDGKILKSYEKFRDIPIPYMVRNIVFQSFPDWTINKNTYVVSYYRDKSITKTYHFQIQKGNEKRNIKMEWKGVK